MFIGKVIGQVVATQKDDKLRGRKLLLVRPLQVENEKNPKLSEYKNTIVAADTCGAGEGQIVLYAQGSSARQADGLKDAPVDAAIIGLVDDIEAFSKQVFGK